MKFLGTTKSGIGYLDFFASIGLQNVAEHGLVGSQRHTPTQKYLEYPPEGQGSYANDLWPNHLEAGDQPHVSNVPWETNLLLYVISLEFLAVLRKGSFFRESVQLTTDWSAQNMFFF